ncbi:MAG: peptide-methionine (S)-S-oxide reductase MsrA [Gemmata sp.]
MSQPQTETAIVGGGCFWCLEAVFEFLNGVQKVESGYAGGTVANPSYEAVCGGRTGHAEVVRVTFNPAVISYGELMEVFFATHDPTTLNRQGHDVGTQYRSVIFPLSPDQRATAETMIAALNAEPRFPNPVVTRIEAGEFYEAEAYHQGYFRNNPGQGYCQFVVGPKVAKARGLFGAKMRSMP